MALSPKLPTFVSSNQKFMENRNSMGIFDWVLILGVVLCNIIYAVSASEYDIIGFIAAISGIVCVVLAAKGNVWNFLFGTIQVTLYAYISFKSTAYGNAAVNALYYLPMQFVGLWQWRKRGASAQESLKARRLSMPQLIIVAAVCAVYTVVLAFLLKYSDASQPWIDAFTTVLCVIAQALMTMAFVEQWYLWIIFNVFTVVMWISFVIQGTAHSVPMLIMYVFYLMNSVNGLISWRKLAAKGSLKG